MAIKINFDPSKNPESPTIVLAKKSGDMLGMLPARGINVADYMNDAAEMSFDVYKYENNIKCNLWDELTDFKLVYCVEWNMWFEITVELDESTESKKTVSCTSLGHAELSQVMLYNIEINTEDDIAREDYKEPTVLYNPEHPENSLLHRIMEKASHYKVVHVDDTIAKIQRMFSFDDKSLYDAFQEIAEEIHCLFNLDVKSDGNGVLQRSISVYDLESNCISCGYRGEFTDKCPECGSTDINEGYGDDTTIIVTPDELSESVNLRNDTDSVKNCFKLEAGDDLMTAAIRSCNPNGSDYIWYITEDSKKDMSDELVAKIADYDEQYAYYQNDYIVLATENDIVADYNDLVDKYRVYDEDMPKIAMPIKGYSALMNAYYNTVDFELYLRSGLMPNIDISNDTTAEEEIKKLTQASLSPVAVEDIEKVSDTTCDNAVLGMAKIVVDSSRFKVKVADSSITDGDGIKTWKGSFTLTNYSDEEDTATSATITVTINDDYETFVKQKIDRTLAKNDKDDMSIGGIFKLDLEEFKAEMKKYCLNRLSSFHDACQTCIDILIEQGIADKETWSDDENGLYDLLYIPYLDKMSALDDEISIRESELAIIAGKNDENGDVEIYGLQNYLLDERNKIQSALDFATFLGDKLWEEFCSFRREDKYSNENYISDGLNNTELFERAREFIKVAQKELYKSAELQRSISADMYNLLVIDRFAPLVEHFEIGNWIRVMADDDVYKLRLIQYEIDYDNLDSISVEFSDVVKLKDSVSDIQSILDQASSMATSYDTIKRQAKQGEKSNARLDNWVNDGLDLTNSKIVGEADNQNITWDSHGILCREYVPMIDSYDDRQLKIINRGLYVTTDNWETSKAGIGNFLIYNPETGKREEKYGVIADTIVGNIILGKNVGVYNESNSITMDENGLVITVRDTINKADGEDEVYARAFTVQNKVTDVDGVETVNQLMYIDSAGNLVLNGSITVNSMYNQEGQRTTLDDLTNPDRFDSKINKAVFDESNVLKGTIDTKYNKAIDEMNKNLNGYKAEVGQYLTFGDAGLTISAKYENEEGVMVSSPFKTVIDNRRMAFYDENQEVAYISNQQLYITSAVISDSLVLGNFFFSERKDGGVSITWKPRADNTSYE